MFKTSYSALSLLWKCPYAYYLSYVLRVKLKVKDITEAVPGLVVHDLAKLFFESKDWNIFDSKFDQVFERRISSKDVFLTKNSFAKDKDTAYKVILKYKDNFILELRERNFVKNITISEGRFGNWDKPMQLIDDIYIMGGWDLLCADIKAGPYILVDFKASESTFFLDKRQLYLYILGIQKYLGISVSLCAFLLFKRRTTEFYPVTEALLEETRVWIRQCKAEFDAGTFLPTPSKFSCKLCKFRARCDYCFFKRKQENEGQIDMVA